MEIKLEQLYFPYDREEEDIETDEDVVFED